MKVLESDLYRSLRHDIQKMSRIIHNDQEHKDDIRPEVKVAYAVGYKMLGIMRTEQIFKNTTIQSIARSLHNILAISSLFPDTKRISYYDEENDEIHTRKLVSSKDIRAYLYRDNLIKTADHYLNEYFARTSHVRYVPKYFYICETNEDYDLEFRKPNMEDIVECYHDIVERIEQRPFKESYRSSPIVNRRWYDEFKGDLYVVEMIVDHRKTHLYRISPQDMEILLNMGRYINYLIVHQKFDDLDALDKIATGLVDLAQRRAISSYHVSNLLSKDDVVREEEEMLDDYHIDDIYDNKESGDFFAGIQDIDQKFVQGDEGYLAPLNIKVLAKDYVQIVKEVMTPVND